MQIATCLFEGAVREYYLKAKAFELTALSAQLLATQRQFAPADVRVTSSDVERVCGERHPDARAPAAAHA